MSGLEKVGWMPEVDSGLKLVLWGSKNFDATIRVIHDSEVGFP